MKKIVILGGGENQIPLINSAKALGMLVVLCDFRYEIRGRMLCDVFYHVDASSFDAIKEVCEIENPDGIITNSEPLIQVMTQVSEYFGYIGNSVSSIKKILSKLSFRQLQIETGVFCPKHFQISNLIDVESVLSELKYPLIIKPSECSGSRGSMRIDNYDAELINKVFDECKHYSRNDNVVIEEYVEMPSLTTIEGDVFIHNCKFIWCGLFSTKRASWAPMVPMTYTAPLLIDGDKLVEIKRTLSLLFNEAGIKYGEYNIEGYFTKSNEFFVIEINARQGGHEIPLLIKDYTSIDFTKLLVTTCVGDDSYWHEVIKKEINYKYVIKHTTFSSSNGKYNGLFIHPSLNQYLKRKIEYLNIGDVVEKCIDGTSLVAIVDMEFPNITEQYEILQDIDNLVKVELQ